MDQIANAAVYQQETERLDARDNLALYHGVHVVSASSTPYITGITTCQPLASQQAGQAYEVDVYEWTWVDYNDGHGGAIDRMGYATEHTLIVSSDSSGAYTIVSDIYDESDILGEYSQVADSSVAQLSSPSGSARAVSASGVNSNRRLQVNALITYADRWVGHAYGSGQAPSNYNTSVYGYYSSDCCNYVSQCLKAGAMANDYGSGKNNEDYGTQWWFDIYPNPNYENYNVSPQAWRYVPAFIKYWSDTQGFNLVSATNSSVFPGNPVINGTAHIGICVGYNSSGVPIINAHNRDVYHVPYTMIGNGTRRTIQIVTSNYMSTKPSNAMTITPTTSYQSVSPYFAAGNENRYYKFTVNTATYYTFESEYYNSTIYDTDAVLYLEQQTSNGQTLYLYEIASDTASGDGSNFKIRVLLQPGTYYLRVFPHYDTSSSGTVTLKYIIR